MGVQHIDLGPGRGVELRRVLAERVTREQFIGRHRNHAHDPYLAICFSCEVQWLRGIGVCAFDAADPDNDPFRSVEVR